MSSLLPPPEVCDRARKARDARFDGLFYTAVRSTRIFCRVSCPAPAPKPQNIVYYPSAAAASSDGYRPCLRCRPELAPALATRGGDALSRALALIQDGWLQQGSIETLSRRVGISSRQLRRLCIARTGASPMTLHNTRRILLARQLIADTDLSMIDVAAASGFESLRRFNSAFKQACHVAPSTMRRRPLSTEAGTLRLRLGYRPPFDVRASLAAMSHRAWPGIEQIDDKSYVRAFGSADRWSVLHITAAPSADELLLDISNPDPSGLEAVVRRVRRMFDLDADLQAAHEVLGRDPSLRQRIVDAPGLRLPGAWDGWEASASVLLEGITDVERRCSTRNELVRRFGTNRPGVPEGIDRAFPVPSTIAHVPLDAGGLPTEIQYRLRDLARALDSGRLHFDSGQHLEEFVQSLTQATGVGSATAHRIAMIALSDPDAAPATMPTTNGSSSYQEAWRPWRAYAALYLEPEASSGEADQAQPARAQAAANDRRSEIRHAAAG